MKLKISTRFFEVNGETVAIGIESSEKGDFIKLDSEIIENIAWNNKKVILKLKKLKLE